jgi:ribose transport system ATP-binding protein
MTDALRITGVSKTFGVFAALRNVSLRVGDGEVVGLIGENGAGKSTLLNILCGVLPADDGEVELHGKPYRPRAYRDAMEAGLFRVYQEPAFVPTMSVAENLVLGFEDRFSTGGLLQRRRIRRAARETLEPLGALVRPDQAMAACDANTQQAIEILRALLASQVLGIERPVILLDEPTAALVADEIAVLFQIMERLREQATFVFVSHRLHEIQTKCDRAYVMKDGAIVAEVGPSTPVGELHSLMVGRERSEDYYLQSRRREPGEHDSVVAAGLGGPRFSDIDLSVREGEVLGVAGLVGSGKEELGKVLVGALRRSDGTVSLDGRAQSTDVPFARLRGGLGYVPQDRQSESVIASFPVSTNLTLSALRLGKCERHGFVSPKLEREATERWIGRLSIRTQSPTSVMSSLSGGNQQKVVMARALESGARSLVLDNPTRGVDAGAKGEIYGLIRDLADDGVAIVLISDDLPELIGLSNRILVLRDGEAQRVVDVPDGGLPEQRLIAEMV